MSQPPAAVSSPQVLLKIAEQQEDSNQPAVSNGELSSLAHLGDPLFVSTAQGNKPSSKSRQPHVLTDEQGNEKTYGSALGMLTRKFLDLIQNSGSGSMDMNEAAAILGVPKRRIYDITNVLEGVGVLEKRSKNTVAWKGSEAILGSAMNPGAKLELERLRSDIRSIAKEDASLDQYMHVVRKIPLPVNAVRLSDVIEALYYPVGDDAIPLAKDALLDETGKPRRAVLAIHTPFDGIADIPTATEGPERQLYVGTRDGLAKHVALSGDQSVKRKQAPLNTRRSLKSPKAEDRVQVFVVSSYFDEKEGKMKPMEMSPLEMDPSKPESAKRSSSWDVAESLANDEGVSDFFGAGEEEAV